MIHRVRPDLVWGTLIGAGVAYETYALNNGREGYTLSENLRAWFRVDRHAGKVAFTAVYLGFSAWFVPHIVAKATAAAVEALSSNEDISP